MKLLEWGSKEDKKDINGETPLHKAAFNGHFDVCLTLLEHDADINSMYVTLLIPYYYNINY